MGEYLYEHKSQLFNFPEEVISESFTFMGMAASAYSSNTKQTDIVVKFPDASRATYTIEYPNKHDETNIEISYIAGSAVDSEMNPIPASLERFRGSKGALAFSDIQSLNFTMWLERAGDLGFEITGDWPDSGSVDCRYACDESQTCEVDCVQNR